MRVDNQDVRVGRSSARDSDNDVLASDWDAETELLSDRSRVRQSECGDGAGADVNFLDRVVTVVIRLLHSEGKRECCTSGTRIVAVELQTVHAGAIDGERLSGT